MRRRHMKKSFYFILALITILGSVIVLKKGIRRAVEVSALDPSSPSSQDGTSTLSSTTSQGQGSGTGTATTKSSTKELLNEKPSAPDSNCFAYEYRHLKEARDRDVEDFLDYSNAFPVHHKNVSAKSICVKVNDRPVAFKLSKNQDEVVIGSVVGPESVIHVAYCTGPAPCREACTVKSNQMMDDLMSDASDSEDFKDSWGDSAAPAQVAQKKELQENVKALRTVASENSDLGKQSVMRTWDTLKSHDWFCKTEKHARAGEVK